MAKKTNLFKNTYVIDMRAVRGRPIEWTNDGVILPIESKNGSLPTSPEDTSKLFAERPARRMIEIYPILFPIVNKAAQTITEYVDMDGNPLITLYPNNQVSIHNKNGLSELSRAAQEDFNTIYARQKRAMEGIAGALRQLKK